MSEDSTFEQSRAGGFVAAAVGASAGSAIDLVAPGVGGAAGVGVQALVNTVGKAIERRRAKAVRVLAEAVEASGENYEEFIERASADDRRSELTLRTMMAAAEATWDSKISALGRAYASGVLADDEATVDIELFIVEALRRLEAPHVRVLDIVSETRIPQQNGIIYRAPELAWAPGDIAGRYSGIGPALGPVLSTLESIGAIEDVSTMTIDHGASYQASDFGRTLLKRLEDVGLPDA